MNIDFKELLGFYKDHVYNNLAAYWMKQLDAEGGGVFNCLSNRGDRRLHEHKFVWSQGRWAYTAARLYQDAEGDLPEETRKSYLETARATAHFLMKHARLASGNCAFVLSREGVPLRLNEDGTGREARGDEVYDYSISADSFAYYGAAEYARVSGDRAAYDWAKDLLLSVRKRETNGTARNEFPYPTPPGYRGWPMMKVEMCSEFAEAARRFGDEEFARELDGEAAAATRLILDHFVRPEGLVVEKLSPDLAPVDTILGRYFNPGHTLEGMWFLMHHAMKSGDRATVERCAEVSRATCRKAWDAEGGGGIPQFMDLEGGQPHGPVTPELEGREMVRKLRELWDKKLWWPHSEALYTLLLVYEQTGAEWALEEYERFHEYTFRTFPNPDEEVGEWIQIRNRAGEPENAIVALPVKDPMHIIRALGHAINALERIIAKG